jgi:hypothetical protein
MIEDLGEEVYLRVEVAKEVPQGLLKPGVDFIGFIGMTEVIP